MQTPRRDELFLKFLGHIFSYLKSFEQAVLPSIFLNFAGKNRHHLALFVRNCKLVLLLRKEYREGEENTFRHAFLETHSNFRLSKIKYLISQVFVIIFRNCHRKWSEKNCQLLEFILGWPLAGRNLRLRQPQTHTKQRHISCSNFGAHLHPKLSHFHLSTRGYHFCRFGAYLRPKWYHFKNPILEGTIAVDLGHVCVQNGPNLPTQY